VHARLDELRGRGPVGAQQVMLCEQRLDLLGELVDALLPGTPAAWKLVAVKPTRPKASCIALSGSIATIVVQLGLAMIPFGGAWSRASGLTSVTTSGTSGSIRQAEELSTTIAPAATACGA
jgi:hypothetical protein